MKQIQLLLVMFCFLQNTNSFASDDFEKYEKKSKSAKVLKSDDDESVASDDVLNVSYETLRGYISDDFSDLDKLPKKIGVINFGVLRDSELEESAVWDFMLAIKDRLGSIKAINFSQSLESSPMIEYFSKQLHDNDILYNMSNYDTADFNFISYAPPPAGDTRSKSLHKYLASITTLTIVVPE